MSFSIRDAGQAAAMLTQSAARLDKVMLSLDARQAPSRDLIELRSAQQILLRLALQYRNM